MYLSAKVSEADIERLTKHIDRELLGPPKKRLYRFGIVLVIIGLAIQLASILLFR